MCHGILLIALGSSPSGGGLFSFVVKSKESKKKCCCRKSPSDLIAEIACAISAGVPQRKNASVWPERTDMTDVIEIHHTF